MASSVVAATDSPECRIDLLCRTITRGDIKGFLRLLRTEATDLHEAFNKEGLSPLHVAIIACHSHHQWHKMSCTLLYYRERLRLDVNVRSKNPRTMGWTALDFAREYNPRAVKVLLSYGCEASGSGNHGYDPLKLQIHRDYSMILRMASPSLHDPPLVHFEYPQSLEPTSLCSPFLIEALLHYEAIFQYQPYGCSGIRYCFPACFPLQLPASEWSETKRYIVHVGRFLAPLLPNINLSKLLVELLTHVLSEIDVRHSVSKSSFCFQTKDDIQCCVAVVTPNGGTGQSAFSRKGLQLLVRSNTSIAGTYDLCNHLVWLIQDMTCDAFEVNVISSSDLHKGELSPHVYPAEEVARARSTDGSLVHPQGQEESLQSLLVIPPPLPPSSQPLYSAHTEPHPSYVCTPEQSPLANSRDSVLRDFVAAKEKPSVVRRPDFHNPSTNIWSTGVYEEAVFKTCYEELVEFMLPERIVPPLVGAGYLTVEQAAQVINPGSTTRCQTMILLGHLKRSLRLASDYEQFLKILREETEHKSHKELKESIMKACTEIAECMSSRTQESSPTPTNSKRFICACSADSGIQSKPSYEEEGHGTPQKPPPLHVRVNKEAGNFANKTLACPPRQVYSPLTFTLSKTRQIADRHDLHVRVREDQTEVEGASKTLSEQLSTPLDGQEELTNMTFNTYMGDLFTSRAPYDQCSDEAANTQPTFLTEPKALEASLVSTCSSSPVDVPGRSRTGSCSSSSSEHSQPSPTPSHFCLSRSNSFTESEETSTREPKVLTEPWKTKAMNYYRSFIQMFNKPSEHTLLPGFGFRM